MSNLYQIGYYRELQTRPATGQDPARIRKPAERLNSFEVIRTSDGFSLGYAVCVELPDEAEQAWYGLCELIRDLANGTPESIRPGILAKVDDILSEFQNARWEHIESKAKTADPYGPAQRADIVGTIAALRDAAAHLEILRGFGHDCYAAAVIEAGAPPSPETLADTLRDYADSMEDALSDAPPILSRQDRFSTERAVKLRRAFLATRLPYPLPQFEMDHLNLFCAACCEDMISEKTYRTDRKAVYEAARDAKQASTSEPPAGEPATSTTAAQVAPPQPINR